MAEKSGRSKPKPNADDSLACLARLEEKLDVALAARAEQMSQAQATALAGLADTIDGCVEKLAAGGMNNAQEAQVREDLHGVSVHLRGGPAAPIEP